MNFTFLLYNQLFVVSEYPWRVCFISTHYLPCCSRTSSGVCVCCCSNSRSMMWRATSNRCGISSWNEPMTGHEHHQYLTLQIQARARLGMQRSLEGKAFDVRAWQSRIFLSASTPLRGAWAFSIMMLILTKSIRTKKIVGHTDMSIGFQLLLVSASGDAFVGNATFFRW